MNSKSHEPMRRPRGRHAVPKTSVEPRISAASAWLFERRVHVLPFTVSLATVAMIGGTLALNPFAGAPRPESEVATVVSTDRPTPTDRAAPSTSAPIVATPGTPPSISPTSPPPQPEEAPAAPAPEAPAAPAAPAAPVEPPAEPGAAEPPRPDTAPAPTTPAENPPAPDPAEDCDEQGGLLGLLGLLGLFGPQCP